MTRIARRAPMVAALFVTTLAFAQGPREPSVGSPAPAWLGYAVMFLIGAGVCFIHVTRSLRWSKS